MTTEELTFDPRADFHERNRMLAMSAHMVIAGAVSGDFAEFGISQGVSFVLLAAAMNHWSADDVRRGNGPRVLHGFDSFEGLPEATAEPDTASPMVQSGVWAAGACSSPGIEAISKFIAPLLPAERVRLYPGWFKDTLSDIKPGQKFALVHLDCDLYESTIQVLYKLFDGDHLSDGCVILFDDFLENRGSPHLGQRRAWLELVGVLYPHHTDLGYYARAGWRCIIHATPLKAAA